MARTIKASAPGGALTLLNACRNRAKLMKITHRSAPAIDAKREKAIHGDVVNLPMNKTTVTHTNAGPRKTLLTLLSSAAFTGCVVTEPLTAEQAELNRQNIERIEAEGRAQHREERYHRAMAREIETRNAPRHISSTTIVAPAIYP